MIAVMLAAVVLSAGNPTTGFEAYGLGDQSCASWTDSPSARAAGDQWILGFWSGLNAGDKDNHFVGASRGEEGILAEMRCYCRAHPAIAIEDAASALHAGLAKDAAP